MLHSALQRARRTEWYAALADGPGMRLLLSLDPETAHVAAILACRLGLTPVDPEPDAAVLATSVLGLQLPNPVGVAAGFDKHAQAMGALLDVGFGFVEVGSVTPQPQPGNPKPRMFRLTADRAVINRYGFNSEGAAAARARLEAFLCDGPRSRASVVGVNLGKNKTSESAVADYVHGAEQLGPLASYVVINVSSPNTPGLRALQSRDELAGIVRAVQQALARAPWRRAHLPQHLRASPPLLIKLAPDLVAEDRRDIAQLALELGVDGLIVSNTTISRPESLQSAEAREAGGLSGAPLAALATEAVRDMYRLTQGRVPIVGVGGVSSGQDAYEKIRAGASLVQLYSALAYEGPGLVRRIKRDLAALLRRDGFRSVQEAVGADAWLKAPAAAAKPAAGSGWW